MTEKELVSLIRSCSGPILNTTPQKCYHSFHFPNLKIEDSQRNTLKRFDAFGISYDLSGKTVCDMGCGVGGLLFEAFRRGADSGMGFEFDEKRVCVANKIAKYLFFNNVVIVNINIDKMNEFVTTAKIVFCCSLDAHVESYSNLYRLMSSITLDVCYFESNRNVSLKTIINDIKMNSDFKEILHLGISSDDAYKRNLFILKKEMAYAKKICYPGDESNSLMYIDNGKVKKYFHSRSIVDKLQTLNHIIGHHPNVLILKKTSTLCCERDLVGKMLFEINPTKKEKANYKKQLLLLLEFLRLKGVSHCDIHTRNILVNNDIILLIDWELAKFKRIENIRLQQDIFGGKDIPYNGYILSGLKESVAKKLDISAKDFL